MAKKKMKISPVVANLIERGYTEEEARKIAQHIGVRKYGKPKFQAKALAGRKRVYAMKRKG